MLLPVKVERRSRQSCIAPSSCFFIVLSLSMTCIRRGVYQRSIYNRCLIMRGSVLLNWLSALRPIAWLILTALAVVPTQEPRHINI